MSHGVISNVISSDIPIGDHRVVGVAQTSEVSHERSTTVRVPSLAQETFDCFKSVGLNCIVGCESDEHWYVPKVERRSEESRYWSDFTVGEEVEEGPKLKKALWLCLFLIFLDYIST